MYNNTIENNKQLNIDFTDIARKSLSYSEYIVQTLLPNGKRAGDEWVTLNPKRADQSPGSFKVNLTTGLWADFAIDEKGGDLISLVAYLKDFSQKEAALYLENTVGASTNKQIESFKESKFQNEKFLPTTPKSEPLDIDFMFDGKKPDGKWEYRDGSNQLLFYTRRFNKNDGDKDILPLTYGIWKGKEGWHCKWIPNNRPLFNLPELLKYSDRPVLVVEGEKTAICAQELFKNIFCVVTSSQGSNAAKNTDWTPLKNRSVYIWPDNDWPSIDMPFEKTPAQIYANIVAKIALESEVKSARIVKIPVEKFPNHWDLADPIPDGYTKNDIEAFLANAISFTRKAIIFSTFGDFRVSDKKGIEKIIVSKKDDEINVIFISNFIDIRGKVKSLASDGWGLALSWFDEDGGIHDYILPMGEFHKRDSTVFIEHLANNGLKITNGKDLAEYLKFRSFDDKLLRLITVSQIGWTPDRDAFILPDKIIGSDKYVYQGKKDPDFETKGTLDAWQTRIARFAIGNTRLTTAISLAFVSPLLKIIGHNGFCIHFYGDSKCGKTTMQYVYGNILGGKKFFKLWRGTANGIEGTAIKHNDIGLGLDEAHLIDPKSFDQSIYFLFEGRQKMRANVKGEATDIKNWDIAILSTGEISSKKKLAEGNIKQQVGQKMRFIDIPATVKDGHGSYDCLHGFADISDLSVSLIKATQEIYGVPSRSFLDFLVKANHYEIKTLWEEFLSKFMNHPKHIFSIVSANNQVKHVARCFALVGFAGWIATKWGITTWPENESLDATIKVFHDWLNNNEFTIESLEENDIIDHLKTQLQMYGSSHYVEVDPQNTDIETTNKHINEIWGFSKIEKGVCTPKVPNGTLHFVEGGIKYFYTSVQGFEKGLFEGYDKKFTVNTLLKVGILIPYIESHGKQRPNHSIRFRGVRSRYYKIDAQKLFDEEDSLK